MQNIVEKNVETISYLKLVEDEGYNPMSQEQIPFFYISDIHLEHYIDRAWMMDKQQEQVQKIVDKMINSVGTIPFNSYLLIAGDTAADFELAKIFYETLAYRWRGDKIVVIAGNHELFDQEKEMTVKLREYKKFLNSLHIIFLQNSLLYIERKTLNNNGEYKLLSGNQILKMSETELQEKLKYSPLAILGGIGFSGLLEEYNATTIRYGKSFDELSSDERLEKDRKESKKFNQVYRKIKRTIPRKTVIVLTHVKKEGWNKEDYNPNWIYLHGHDHRNYFLKDSEKTIYADNQMGNHRKSIGLKYFYCSNEYDVFENYKDGCYKITKEQYREFYVGKSIEMEFNQDDLQIAMIKKSGIYMFLGYCIKPGKRTYKGFYLMHGGRKNHLAKFEEEGGNWKYYAEHLEEYLQKLEQIMKPYTEKQEKIAKFIKKIGGIGRIHGFVIDIDDWGGYGVLHLWLNPYDGKVTPYYGKDSEHRIVYPNLEALLKEYDFPKWKKYIEAKKEYPVINNEYPDLRLEKPAKDEGYIYKESKIWLAYKRCVNKHIITIWNKKILQYETTGDTNKLLDDIIDADLLNDEN